MKRGGLAALQHGARLVCFLQILGTGTALAQNNALRLGPTNTNTYVTFGSTSALGLSQFTVETWFNRQGAGVTTSTGTGGIGALIPLVTKGAGQAEASNVDANYILGINTAGNVIAADFEEGAGGSSPGLNHPVSGITPIQNGIWYHAAATYDGSTWRLYLNGVLEAEVAVGQPTRSDSIQHAGLGATLNSSGTPSGFFDGIIDEARVWNTARSEAQIRSTLNVQDPSEATLVARWGLNEGAGTNINDSAGTAQNGTITGTNFSWVAGAPFDIAPCEDPNGSSLRFDGTNDYVTFGTSAELGLPQFTIETWFIRTGAGVGNTTGSGGIASLVPLIAKGAPESDGSNVDANYVLGINTSGNVLAADFEDNATGLNHPISGTTAVTDNVWHHAAATYDGSTWRLYLDGILDATLVVGAFTPRFDSIQPAGLATMQKSASNPGQLGFFAGALDEVRIWSVARSPSEIQADMSEEITAGTGLVARWGMNEGSGTTISDSVAPATTGNLNNGPSWLKSNVFTANGPCDDAVFCNGSDTCNGTALRCSIHDGDPCAGGGECADNCNEAADNCFDTAGTSCTADGNPCTDDVCDGAGSCGVDNAASCDDGLFCNGTDTCSGGACGHSGDPCSGGGECADSCNEAMDDCFDAVGTTCGDGSDTTCTHPDTCDGAGTCNPNHESATTVCREASDACDAAESCDGAGSCPADGVRASGAECRPSAGECDGAETCDGVAKTCPADAKKSSGTSCTSDGNPCTLDECDGAAVSCQHPAVADDTPCPNGLYCDGDETCQDGSCQSGVEPCLVLCDETLDQCTTGCAPAPQSGCRDAGKSVLVAKDNADDAKDKLVWKWLKGAATSLEEFGDPTESADYALCFYAGAPPTLLGEAIVPASASKWQGSSSKYGYTDPALSAGGIQKMLLKSGQDTRAKTLAKGKGVNLPDLVPPIAEPLTVQLVNGDNGVCWSSQYSATQLIKNQEGLLKAKAP